MTERWRPFDEGPEPQPRVIHCWACEELLAFQNATGNLILDANASEHAADQQHLLICGCGERTVLPLAARTEERRSVMSNPESAHAAEAQLVVDYRHETRGMWRDGAVFRIRIFSRDDNTPVVIASELPENTSVSVTNVAEVLAAEVMARHLPQRFEHEEPVVWLEQYPPTPERKGEKFAFERVTFDSWTPRAKYVGGIQRVSLGEPHWMPLTADQLAGWLGSDTARALVAEGTPTTPTTHDG